MFSFEEMIKAVIKTIKVTRYIIYEKEGIYFKSSSVKETVLEYFKTKAIANCWWA